MVAGSCRLLSESLFVNFGDTTGEVDARIECGDRDLLIAAGSVDWIIVPFYFETEPVLRLNSSTFILG